MAMERYDEGDVGFKAINNYEFMSMAMLGLMQLTIMRLCRW